jgi:hypothetical protein
MSSEADPLPGTQGREEELWSFSNMQHSRAEVCRPADEEQLRQIFSHAQRESRKVTLRGGGHAFDGQSLGREPGLVVSMESFDPHLIDVAADQKTVTVGAGATWGDIVNELAYDGLVMPGTVTTKHATAGGTLASDCLSRFSPIYGKEGAMVQSFDLMTVDGNVNTYHRPADDADPTTSEAHTFLAVVGGFGYLGAILRATYRVMSVQASPMDRIVPDDASSTNRAMSVNAPSIWVKTTINKDVDFSDLADKLVRDASPDTPVLKAHAIWAGLYPQGMDKQTALILNSTLTTARGEEPPFLLYESAPMKVAEPLLLSSHMHHWLMNESYHHLEDGKTFCDPLEDFAFFMDANTKIRREVTKLRLGCSDEIQQTFFLPDADQEQLNEWLARTEPMLTEAGLDPIMVDVGYLPRDNLPFFLSPSADSAGFAVSYAFAAYKADRQGTTKQRGPEHPLHRACEVLCQMSRLLWEEFRGRVSLVKNVYAEPEILAKMYGSDADQFFAVKRRLDPKWILSNDFLERVFRTHCPTGP